MRDSRIMADFWTGGPQPWPESGRIIAARRILAGKVALRENFLLGLMHDPAIEIMLGAFVADSTGNAVRYDDVPGLVGVDAAIAHRWIAFLSQRGLVRVKSAVNGKMLELTAQGLATTVRAVNAVIARQADSRG